MASGRRGHITCCPVTHSIVVGDEELYDSVDSRCSRLKTDKRQWHNPPETFQFEQTSADLQHALRIPEIVMECLCNTYLEPAVKTKLRTTIAPSGGQSQPNQCHHLIAKLVSSGKVKGIITPNFDSLLEQSLESAKIPHQVILPSASSSTSTSLPLYKVHGSIDSSEKLAFLRGTYLRGSYLNLRLNGSYDVSGIV